jgi:hypothetical protein
MLPSTRLPSASTLLSGKRTSTPAVSTSVLAMSLVPAAAFT